MSTIINSAKSKKSKSIKLKKSNFPNTKANSKTDFLISKAKETFIYLQKVFTKAPIFRHFDSKHHIWIETNAPKYAIDEVLNQIILDLLDQFFSNYVTYKNLDLISSKSEIGQWHPVVFFFKK